MDRISISNKELSSIQQLLNEITTQYSSVKHPKFLEECSLFAYDIPRRLQKFINDFRLLEPSSGVCIISGYPIDDNKIGRTPSHWNWRPEISPTLEEEILLVLFGSLLGDVFAWGTQQDGQIIHNILPIKGYENEQSGSSSRELLWWHNEDAFHPHRADYIGMLCLRNPDNVATTIASIDRVHLDREKIDILFEPRFIIRPDKSHLEKRSHKSQEPKHEYLGLIEPDYQRINQMNNNPSKVSVLYGDKKSPYLRIDPYFMDDVESDREAQIALNALIKAIDISLLNLILKPGDFCFIDNHKAVHGRKPFSARYDGNDRWLKRINITRDLRKSRSYRLTSASRIIV